MTDEVDRPVRADGVGDREEVVRQLLQGEAAAQRAGAVDRPWPRTSYSTTWNSSASRTATSDHTSLESG